MEKDLQYNRILFKTKPIIDNIKFYYPEYKILIGNFSYILKHNKKNIIKIYFQEKYLYKELFFYKIFSKNKINTPQIISQWTIRLHNKNFYFIEYENIRLLHKKFYSYKQIWIKKLSSLLSKLHSIEFNDGKWLTHGNLHPSNFFLRETELWVFDFLSLSIRNINYDFGKILYHSNINLHLIKSLIKYYKYKNYINLKYILGYCYITIKNNLIHNKYINKYARKNEKNNAYKIVELIKKFK